MTSTRSTLLAAVCGLALAAPGCGGDDNDTLSYDDTGTEISEICTRLDDLGEGLTGEPDNDAPILKEAAPEFEAAIEDIRELEVNEELESARDELVANGEEQLALIEQAITHAEAGDRRAYRRTLEQGQSLDEEGNEVASRLGAEGCIN
jgi:hypothetical protein